MRHVTISRNDDLYEAFPDLCLLPSGKLLCIYRESDWHVSSTSRTMLTESDDRGRTWTNHRPFDVTRTFAEHRSVWNAPRIAMLPDGRVVANFDAFVFPDEADSWTWPQSRTCNQTFLWFSDDEGQTWSEPQLTEVQGICPDKVRLLSDEHWLMAISQWSIRFPGAFRVQVAHSFDAGRTWPQHALAAEQPGVQHAEPSLVRMPDQRLLCVMRENVHTTRPSHCVVSDDDGRTWSTPRPAPFYADRPAAGLLQSRACSSSSTTPANPPVTMATAAGCSSTTVRSSAPTTIVTMRRSRTSAAAGSARRTFRRQDSAGPPLYE
jgi:sialidase-1